MLLQQNIELKNYSTMKLGGIGKYFVEVHEQNELAEACIWAKGKSLPIICLGLGSNVIWRDSGFDGLLIANRIKGKKIISDDEDLCKVEFGAGEIWDEAVEWTVTKNLSGLEFLSLIPGTVGATPVQNVGAYGAEVSQLIMEVTVYDIENNREFSIACDDCNFSYRDSRFKHQDKNNLIITAVSFKLSKHHPKPPFYKTLEEYIKDNNMQELNPQTIRQAVIDIRKSKLPDPSVHPNNGSFYKNPIISEQKFIEMKKKYPNIVGWDFGDNRKKIPAAWLIDSSGYSDYHDNKTGMATWKNQPLVIVNERARSTNDLLEFNKSIIKAVENNFGIVLEVEPEFLP